MLASFRLRRTLKSAIATLALIVTGATLTSCTRAPIPVLPAVPVPGVSLHGMIHGGQQPVKNSTIQLYAVGSGGDGSASTALLAHTVPTDGGGNFNITGLYTCPSASSLVYIVSIGGDPGMGANNPNLAEMAALGPCGSLSASTFIVITEVTTVASVYELAPYMTSYSAIGHSSTDLADITAAFAEVNQLVNIGKGTAPGTGIPAGQGVPVEQINTLADILASCVNSAGGTAGDSTVCGRLATYTGLTGTADTIAAMLQIAKHPSLNLSSLYSLISPNSPFQPILPSAPTTWNIAPAPFTSTPTISPNGGTYNSVQTITLTDPTANATIYYTLDGTTPTLSSLQYNSPFTLATSATIKAFASAPGHVSSSISTSTYVISVPPVSNSSIIQTIAGNGADPGGQGFGAYAGDGGQATSASLSVPESVAVDSSGNIYIADTLNFVVRKVTTAGIISTIAGIGHQGYSGDGGLATSAAMSRPFSVVVDNAGSVYIADPDNQVVRKVDGNGIISTIAGNGQTGYSGDGGLATSAALHGPYALALDTGNNLYIADRFNHVVRKVTPAGIIATFAGNTSATPSGDGSLATNAGIGLLSGVAADKLGNVYVGDDQHGQIRKINASGIISTAAGDTTPAGFAGQDGGLAIHAWLGGVSGVAVDAANNVYFTDQGSGHVRKVDTAGIISTVAGNGTIGFNGDGGSALSAGLNDPEDVAIGNDGTLYIADTGNHRIRKVTFGAPATVSTPTFTPAAGTYTSAQTVTISTTTAGASIYYSTDGSTPTASSYPYTGPITVSTTETIQAIAVKSGLANSPIASAAYTILTFQPPAAPTFSPAAGTYSSAQTVTLSTTTAGASIFYTTDGSAPTTGSTPYTTPIAVSSSQTIRALASISGPAGSGTSGEASATYTINIPNAIPIITTVAGSGNGGYTGDGNAATLATLNGPTGAAVSSNGSLYIADTQNHVIRKVNAAGIITTVAGNGNQAYTGDGGQAALATLDSPSGVAVDAAGNLFIADAGNNVIRKVTPAGIISTYAGNGQLDYTGDGGQATAAALSHPTGVALSATGILYIADYENSVIRKVALDGTISTYAGNGDMDFYGDGGPATSAALQLPGGVALDANGDLFIADTANSVVRVVTPDGNIATYAGTGQDPTALGDGGPALGAFLGYPTGVATDSSGNLYIADAGLSLIRKVTPSGASISTVTGIGQPGFSGDNGPANQGQLNQPGGVAVDTNGNIYIADTTNNRIREVSLGTVTAPGTTVAPTFSPAAGTYDSPQTVTISTTTPSADIYYTTDGSTPTASSTLYTGSITVSATETINAIAIAPNLADSSIATAAYTITTPTAAAPTFSPAAGTYTTAQLVTIINPNATGNYSIYFTTDGSDPTTSSSQYDFSPIQILATQTLKAIVVAAGASNSPIASAGYTINLPAVGTITNITPTGNIFGFGSFQGLAVTSNGNILVSSPDPYHNGSYGGHVWEVSPNGTIIAKAGGLQNPYVTGYQPNVNVLGNPTSISATGDSVVDSGGTAPGLCTNGVDKMQAFDLVSNIYDPGTFPVVCGSLQVYNPNSYNYTSTTNLGPITGLAGLVNYGSGYISEAKRIFSLGGAAVGNQNYNAIIAGAGSTAQYFVTLNNVTGLALNSAGLLHFIDTNVVESLTNAGANGIIAGTGIAGFSGDGGDPAKAKLSAPRAINFDSQNNLYIADTGNNRIRLVSNGVITTIAGNGTAASTGDNGPAIAASLNAPIGVAPDNLGNVYVIEGGSNIRRIYLGPPTLASPTFTPVAGSYSAAQTVTLTASLAQAAIYYTTDGSTPTTSSTLYTGPITVSQSQTVKAIAHVAGFTDSAPAVAAYVITASAPTIAPASGFYTTYQTVTISSATPNASIYYTTDNTDPTTSSTLYTGPFTIKKSTGIKAIAAAPGYPASPVTYNGITITLPQLSQPTFAPYAYSYSVFFTPTTLTLSAQSGASIYYTTDGTTPNTTSTLYTGPFTISGTTTVKAIAVEDQYTASTVASFTYNFQTSNITSSPVSGTYTSAQTVTLTPTTPGATIYYTTNGTTPTTSSTKYTGPILVSSTETITAISTLTGYTTYGAYAFPFTINLPAAAPTFSPASGSYTSAQSVSITSATTGASIRYTTDGSAPSASSTLYTGPITVSNSETVKAVALGTGFTSSAVASAAYIIYPPGTIITVAGNGTAGHTGDGGQALSAELNAPNSIAFDSAGNAYVSEYPYSVRKITPSGVISTFAGNAISRGYSGDGGQAVDALLYLPTGLAVDANNNVYIADSFNQCVRKVTPNGTISTFAGNGNAGYSGDGGQATNASLNYPQNLAIGPNGEIYISDQGSAIRKVTPNGIITTVAGTGVQGFSGDGGPATSAKLHDPDGIAVDAAGNLYIADFNNLRIRKVNTSGTISTVWTNADGTVPPSKLKVDASKNLYFTSGQPAIYKLDSFGSLSVLAGQPSQAGFSGDGGPATSATLGGNLNLAISGNNLYVVDNGNERVREIVLGTYPTAVTPVFSPAGGTYTTSQTVTLTSATSGAAIYYTIDGTSPTTSSSLYTAPITVSASETLQAIAIKAGYVNSPVATAVYTINLSPASAPLLLPAAGTYTSAQTVTISSTGPTFYTLDGSIPSASSTPYTAPITVSSSETIKAITPANAYHSTSPITTAAYVINIPVPTITSVSAISAQKTQTITITGTGFGNHAPYTGSSFYISLWNDSSNSNYEAGYGGDAVGLVVSSWTNTQIVLQGYDSGYGGYYSNSNGDHLRLWVWNAQIDRTGLYDPSAGNTPGICTNIIVGGGATTCH